jgi:hypothetical protein
MNLKAFGAFAGLAAVAAVGAYIVENHPQTASTNADFNGLGDTALPDGGTEEFDGGSECACYRPDAGACEVPNWDEFSPNPWIPAHTGVTLYPQFQGDGGCFPKACREPAGAEGSSWPDECPR